jgi:hypothetical protein
MTEGGRQAHSPLSGDSDPVEDAEGVVLDEPGEPRAAAG